MTAVDGGNPARTGSVLVVIKVEDVNDERPKFSQASYAFKVFENELPGIKVRNGRRSPKDTRLTYLVFTYLLIY